MIEGYIQKRPIPVKSALGIYHTWELSMQAHVYGKHIQIVAQICR
jgi:hypothetical protein